MPAHNNNNQPTINGRIKKIAMDMTRNNHFEIMEREQSRNNKFNFVF